MHVQRLALLSVARVSGTAVIRQALFTLIVCQRLTQPSEFDIMRGPTSPEHRPKCTEELLARLPLGTTLRDFIPDPYREGASGTTAVGQTTRSRNPWIRFLRDFCRQIEVPGNLAGLLHPIAMASIVWRDMSTKDREQWTAVFAPGRNGSKYVYTPVVFSRCGV